MIKKHFHLLLKITICIFATEFIIMILLPLLPPMNKWMTALIDAVLIVGCVYPTLYLKIFKSLKQSILELKQTEISLQRSKANLIEAQQIASLGNWFWDLRNNEIKWSDEIYNIYGFDKAVTPSIANVSKHIMEEDRLVFDNAIKDAQSGKIYYKIEYRFKRPDGEIHHLVSRARANRDSQGVTTSLSITVQDITERKLAEKALQESEEKYRLVVDNTDTGFVVVDEIGAVVEANEPYLRLIGAKKIAEIIGRSVIEWTAQECKKENEKAVALCAKQGYVKDFETTYVRDDGTKIIILINAIMQETSHGKRLAAQCCNITKRKRAEQALRASEKKYRLIFETAAKLITSVDSKGILVDCNNRIEKILGYKREEIIGENITKIIHPDYHSKAYESLAELITSGIKYNQEYKMVQKDGRLIDVIINSSSITDEQGNFLRSICIIDDITMVKQLQEKLQDNEEYVRTVLESTADGILAIDGEGNIKHTNRRFAEMWRIPPDLIETGNDEKLLNHVLEQLKDPDAFILKVKQLYRSPEEDTDILSFKDERIFERFSCPLKRNGTIDGRIWSFRDITETNRLQALESRAERLEMAGTIAGQVAHDFNNLLAPLIAYPEFIRDELPDDHKAIKYLNQIEKASQKIADINQDLLAMGRRGHYSREVLNLNKIVQNALMELEPYPQTLACEIDLCDNLMSILGGGAQLHRMISNLLHNAQDAMQGIGQISVKTENYYVNEVTIVYGQVPKGEYVKLTVSDTGCGIPDDIIQKIFDPFFTSKTTNKKHGTGLGMSVVDAVIKDHNGYIDLTTKVGVGTSFYVYLPITRESIKGQPLNDSPGGNETILVVDDDDTQREVSSRLLNKLGYNVSTVESGKQAIEFLRDNPQDLVILDMVMPEGIDGTETFRLILDMYPNQKAIILSGFSESSRIIEAQKLGAGSFVKKPVTRKIIAAAVRSELDRVEQPATI